MASGSGIGVVRVQMIEGSNADPVVALAASAHLRLLPMLGLPVQLTPSAAAVGMAGYVAYFAQRYGPGGTFWAQNPQLPYLPVESYEIGNEPNIPLQWIADGTNLHWTDPTAYAQVYEAARTALHQVDPSGVAVVGGLADSASLGVDVQHDEEWLAALTPGEVDAVGYHPYTFDVNLSLMRSDTEELRNWMDANGFSATPIDINEIGACDVLPQDTLDTGCSPNISSSDWGTFAASFATWALCVPSLHVQSVVPFYWGDIPTADLDAILPMVSTEGALTPYGQVYLAAAQSLTTVGCPPENTTAPTISGSASVDQTLTGQPGAWTVSNPTLSYQWERCDGNGQDCSDVPGATSPSYQVQSGDVGSTLLVAVTAANGVGSTSALSAPTAVIAGAGSNPGGGPGGGGNSGGGNGGGNGSGGNGSGGGNGGGSGNGGGGNAGGGGASGPAPRPVPVQVTSVHVNGSSVTLTIRIGNRSARITATAIKGHKRVQFHVTKRAEKGTMVTLGLRLPAGRWTVVISGSPPSGYTTVQTVRRTLTVR